MIAVFTGGLPVVFIPTATNVIHADDHTTECHLQLVPGICGNIVFTVHVTPSGETRHVFIPNATKMPRVSDQQIALGL